MEAGLEGPSFNSFSISEILGSGILNIPDVILGEVTGGFLFESWAERATAAAAAKEEEEEAEAEKTNSFFWACSDTTRWPVKVTLLGVMVDIMGVPDNRRCCFDLSGSTVSDLDTISSSTALDLIFFPVSMPELILMGGDCGWVGGGKKDLSPISSSSSCSSSSELLDIILEEGGG